MSAAELPLEVQHAFFGETEVEVNRLGVGNINRNYTVRTASGERYVVQSVNGIFEAGPLAEDIVYVSDHLRANGWKAPELVPTTEGEYIHYVQKDPELVFVDGEFELAETPKPEAWRAMTFIESDGKPNADPGDIEAMRKCGAMLARWHITMQKLDYEPQHRLEYFHDTSHHFAKFQVLASLMPDEASASLSQEVLAGIMELPELPDFGDQLLHGDPKTDNMLFRDGQPFTFIDFDTVMKGKIWIDIGDLLRSLGENAVLANQPVPIEALEAAVESYRAEAFPDIDPHQFKTWAKVAMKLIAGELTMRFLNDMVERNYFVELTQERRFTEAVTQWEVFKSVSIEETV